MSDARTNCRTLYVVGHLHYLGGVAPTFLWNQARDAPVGQSHASNRNTRRHRMHDFLVGFCVVLPQQYNTHVWLLPSVCKQKPWRLIPTRKSTAPKSTSSDPPLATTRRAISMEPLPRSPSRKVRTHANLVRVGWSNRATQSCVSHPRSPIA